MDYYIQTIGSHTELSADFPGVIPEEDILGPVAAVETKILDPNAISNANAANSGITNTTGVHDARNTPTPIFTIKLKTEAGPDPTPEAESENEQEDNNNDGDDD